MAIKKHGARVNPPARKDIRATRATGRAYVVYRGDYPAYVVMPDGTIDKFTTRPDMPERGEIMETWAAAHNTNLDILEGKAN